MSVQPYSRSTFPFLLSFSTDCHDDLVFSYTEHYITDVEFSALPVRMQDQVRRMAANHAHQPQAGWGMNFYSPAPPQRYRRFGESSLLLAARYFVHLLCRLAARAMVLRRPPTVGRIYDQQTWLPCWKYICDGSSQLNHPSVILFCIPVSLLFVFLCLRNPRS
jgi:hypothetical protein